MNELLLDLSGPGLANSYTQTWLSVAMLGAVGFVLGFALNHGSVCTVIATRELIQERRPARSIALVEGAVWATLTYAILQTPPKLEEGWLPLVYLVPASMLFGLGTYINSACVFGSVGHFGNGEIDFGFVFVGIGAVFYLESLFGLLPDQPPTSGLVPLGIGYLVFALMALLTLRLAVSVRTEYNFRRLTLSIGALGTSYTTLAVVAPGFSITATFGSIVSVPVAISVVSVCMVSGSLLSARLLQGRFQISWPTMRAVGRRTIGGVLMGLGALLIPGGNDTLLMIGFPMGAWQAALAYAVFAATIAILIARYGSTVESWS